MSRHVQPAAEHGFSMMAVMLVMLATSLLAGAAFAAVGGDIPFARAAQDRKQAYAAAEAGVEYYLYQLARDNDYWTKCDQVPGPAPGQPSPVNLAGTPNRKWRKVTGTDARYSIELLPAPGKPRCDPANSVDTMLDKATGTFRIRSTGESRGIRRSIVATFRRSSFLDYLYFTDYETSDPQTYDTSFERAWANTYCVRYRAQRDDDCREITFPDFDAIRGPFHTNDDMLVCGSPDFGRTKADVVEISGPAPQGWAPNGCAANPDFLGTKRHPAPSLTVPTSNAVLRDVAAQDGYVFQGNTIIRFDGDDTMQVTTYPTGDIDQPLVETKLLPNNGVIYVDHRGACSPGIDPPRQQRYGAGARCAILTVRGTYPKSMTLGSKSDIVIDGDLLQAGDSVLGLIAENFVRIKHRVGLGCGANVDALPNVTVEAAILTLAHSFVVDNYQCGARLGTLTVDGAIAQRFRGAVGTFDTRTGTGQTGYTKNYEYDDRLRYRSPPYFLDPISAAWRVVKVNEQVPAAK